MKPKDRIIFPLDGMDLSGAVGWMAKLYGKIGMAKLGLELFVREGSNVVQHANHYSLTPVMLDLKLNDIPNTMEGATKAAVDMGVKLLTVHASAGREALERCVRATEGSETKIVAVTVLTSLDDVDAARIFQGRGVWYHPGNAGERHAARIFASGSAANVVERFVVEATEAGVTHFVCSPREVALIDCMLEDVCIITPGIRPPRGAEDDQKRVSTPRRAIADGATYLVVGRPIRTAKDPLKVIDDLCSEIALGCEDYQHDSEA